MRVREQHCVCVFYVRVWPPVTAFLVFLSGAHSRVFKAHARRDSRKTNERVHGGEENSEY